MSKKDRKTKFTIELGLSHIKIKSIKIDNFGDFHIYVSCMATETVCHTCGKTITNVHGHCQETVIEHLPIFDQRVFIHVKWPRFKCPDCDNNPTTSFRPPWLSGNGQQTIPYEDYCLKWLINSTIKDVADKVKTTEEVIEGILSRRVNIGNVDNLLIPVLAGSDQAKNLK